MTGWRGSFTLFLLLLYTFASLHTCNKKLKCYSSPTSLPLFFFPTARSHSYVIYCTCVLSTSSCWNVGSTRAGVCAHGCACTHHRCGAQPYARQPGPRGTGHPAAEINAKCWGPNTLPGYECNFRTDEITLRISSAADLLGSET